MKHRRLRDETRARNVWQAAKIPGVQALDENGASQLGKELAWATSWYKIAAAPSPYRQREQLEKIERAATKLAKLLAESSSIQRRLNEFWPFYYGRAGIKGTRLGLAALRKAARDARIVKTNTGVIHRKGGIAVLREKFGSRERLFIFYLAKAYKQFSGRRATVSYNDATGLLGGPFVRFVQEAARELHLPVPSEETIKEALLARRMKEARKKLLALILWRAKYLKYG